jgi:hypothetical protein
MSIPPFSLSALSLQEGATAISPFWAAFTDTALKLVAAAVIGWLASNITIGRKLTAVEGRITKQIVDSEKHSDERVTRLEHEMWGAKGTDGGMRNEVKALAEESRENGNKLIQLTGKIDALLLMLGSQHQRTP